MPTGLQIKELTASYNGKPAVKNLTLDIPAGKVTALIGPSGCGKTTLLRSINRLHEVNGLCKVKGQIILDGEDILRMDVMLLRRNVGMVFQKPNPFPMSVRENVLYGIRAAKRKVDYDALVRQSLTQAGIWEEIKDRLKDSAIGLSLGQQQRVCLARTLAMSPEVILMDEPAASLDPASASRVEASITAMRDSYTVVIVTHNMQQARRVSDYTAFMYLGELVEFGPTEEIFTSPKRVETQEYVEGRFG
jgi:phosphate transport system ATP-binding protein